MRTNFIICKESPIKPLLITTIIFFVSHLSLADNIAYIGDSQSAVSYGLLSQLQDSLSGAGHSLVGGRSVCGATINNYLGSVRSTCNYRGITNMQVVNGQVTYPAGRGQTDPVNTITQGADSVIVQLGDNHLGDPEGASTMARALAQRILDQGQNCIWIGPASANGSACSSMNRRKREISEAIKSALSSPEFLQQTNGRQCRFIDSHSLTTEARSSSHRSTRDCLHYTNYSGWAESIQEPLLNDLNGSEEAGAAPVVVEPNPQPDTERADVIELDDAFTLPDVSL